MIDFTVYLESNISTEFPLLSSYNKLSKAVQTTLSGRFGSLLADFNSEWVNLNKHVKQSRDAVKMCLKNNFQWLS